MATDRSTGNNGGDLSALMGLREASLALGISEKTISRRLRAWLDACERDGRAVRTRKVSALGPWAWEIDRTELREALGDAVEKRRDPSAALRSRVAELERELDALRGQLVTRPVSVGTYQPPKPVPPAPRPLAPTRPRSVTIAPTDHAHRGDTTLPRGWETLKACAEDHGFDRYQRLKGTAGLHLYQYRDDERYYIVNGAEAKYVLDPDGLVSFGKTFGGASRFTFCEQPGCPTCAAAYPIRLARGLPLGKHAALHAPDRASGPVRTLSSAQIDEAATQPVPVPTLTAQATGQRP